jgi:hypothetical protein
MVQIRQKRPYTISLKFKHIASNPWMIMLLQGKAPYDDLLGMFDKDLEADDISILVDCILNRPLRYRNRAMAVLSHLADNDIQSVAAFLFVHPRTVGRYIQRFRSGGVQSTINDRRL